MKKPRAIVRAFLRLLRPRRRFPPTREGWWFISATLVVGLAAINSGYNLLFLVWGMMLFLILASGVMSELGLRGLVATRTLPGAAYAGTPYLMGIALRNGKGRLPSFSIEVEDLVADRPHARRCFFLKLPAGRTQQTSYRHTIDHRGVHRVSGFRISTKFPFGLIRKSRDVVEPAEILVYPALVPVSPAVLPAPSFRRGSNKSPRRSRRGDFFGLREYRQGDDPRDIHWRTSARRGRPYVRESEDESGRLATVLFDNAVDPRRPAPPAGQLDAAFEQAVSLVASLALELLKRGYRVGLGTRGASLAPDTGPTHAARMLGHLALVVAVSDSLPLPDAGADGLRLLITAGVDRPRVENLDLRSSA